MRITAVNSDNLAPAPAMMLATLKTLRTNLQRAIDEEITPRLKDERISPRTRSLLRERLTDLEKSIHEISSLERRLERL